MDYWLDLFTGTTWDEFRRAGAKTTGFTHRHRNSVSQIKPGDILLCYLTGVKQWVGALKVVGQSKDDRRIWKDAEFPVRLSVEPLIMLDPEVGVPMGALQGKVEFYQRPDQASGLNGFVRRSPNRFKRCGDGELVFSLLKNAQTSPVRIDLDPKKLAKKPFFKADQKKGKGTVATLVAIPEAEEQPLMPGSSERLEEQSSDSAHCRIQYELLTIGVEMGFDVWVARNDRGRTVSGMTFSAIEGLVKDLPTQFNEATNRTIELIDVLWLKGNSIVAAFEVECTTAVYSGLLRMSDLLALQPNLEIKLYLVAPDDRREKVEREILRPTFKLREKPLSEVCGYLALSKLEEKIKGIRRLGLAKAIKADFLDQMAEYFKPVTRPG